MAGSQIVEQSKRLKKVREHLGWSQIELSGKLGINQTYLSAIETGKRGISRNLISRLSDLFPNLNMQWLIKGEGEMQLRSISSTGNPVQVTTNPVQLIDDLVANEAIAMYGIKDADTKHLLLRIKRLEQFILKKFPDYPIDEL